MTRSARPVPSRRAETGAITILVALGLLVLLTVAAVGVARSTLGEVVITASARQGAMTSSEADTGLDWACYWLAPANFDLGGSSGDPVSQAFVQAVNTSLADLSATGTTTTLAAKTTSTSGGHTDTFALEVTRMGKLVNVNNGSRSVSNWRLLPDVWAVRSNAQVEYPSGPKFVSAKESWLSTPVRN